MVRALDGPAGRRRGARIAASAASRDASRGVARAGPTREAAVFGQDNGINLLGVQRLLALIALIAKRTPGQQRALPVMAAPGNWWRPTCVN